MSRVARAFHRALVPLAAYYAVTLAIPLANGAAQSNAVFITHALVVLVIPPAIILLACAAHAAAHVLARAWRKGLWCGENGSIFAVPPGRRREIAEKLNLSCHAREFAGAGNNGAHAVVTLLGDT